MFVILRFDILIVTQKAPGPVAYVIAKSRIHYAEPQCEHLLQISHGDVLLLFFPGASSSIPAEKFLFFSQNGKYQSPVEETVKDGNHWDTMGSVLRIILLVAFSG